MRAPMFISPPTTTRRAGLRKPCSARACSPRREPTAFSSRAWTKLDEITRFARALERPLNVYAGYPGVPAIDALSGAGVRRVSLGCGPLQSALNLLGRIAAEAFTLGRYDAMARDMLPASDLNRLFAPRLA